jgi:hypothetical protein
MNDFLKTLAPTLASALLGPLGGAAVAALGSVFGIKDATIATISKQFEDGKITPDQLAEIKKLELEYQDHEKEREFKYADLEFKDKDSARQMQIVTQSNTPSILTYLITGGFFGILIWMLADDSVINSPPLLVMLGSLGTAWTACVSYWFGTTSGSARKDILLAQSVPSK